MDKLISEQAAIDIVEFECGEWRGLAGTIVEAIEQLPPAQPEIIWCKDCEHVRKWRSEESAKKFGQIYECARGVLNCPKPEDFCSKAERREENE
jgi:hypothetical protein